MRELVPGTVIAGYRIEAVAGRGGMGVVYRATQLALQRTVALKVIAPQFASDPDFRARFKREALTAASIDHPNVITVHDAREEGELLFLTMGYVDGTDLRETIAREGRLEPRRAARIIAAVASALDAAHAAGLVHRDVKPANVLLAYVRGEEHVYLTDFGLTKQTSSESGMTKTGMFVGTLDYVAPEQLQGGPVDARTDTYSLGCVLYQALTGQVPYPRDSDLAKLFAHANMPPPSVSAAAPDLDPTFDAVVAKAMAKDPDDRYPSAGDLGRAALAAARGQEVTRAERTVAAGGAAPTGPLTAVPATRSQRDPDLPIAPSVRPAEGANQQLDPGADHIAAVRVDRTAAAEGAAGPVQAAAVAQHTSAPPAGSFATRRASQPARSRRGRVIAIAAGGAVAVVIGAVAVLLASGGGGHQLPPFTSDGYRQMQLDGVGKFANDLHSQYTPGVVIGGPDCKPAMLPDAVSVPIGGSFDCSFAISSRYFGGRGTMHDLLRVTSVDPIAFRFADCYFQPHGGGKRQRCP